MMWSLVEGPEQQESKQLSRGPPSGGQVVKTPPPMQGPGFAPAQGSNTHQGCMGAGQKKKTQLIILICRDVETPLL